MSSPSIIPNDRLDRDFYIVLENFAGGAAFRETDEDYDYHTLITDLLLGQFGQVLRVVGFNPAEGWSRDTSEDIARELERNVSASGSGDFCNSARDSFEPFRVWRDVCLRSGRPPDLTFIHLFRLADRPVKSRAFAFHATTQNIGRAMKSHHLRVVGLSRLRNPVFRKCSTR